VLGAHHRSTGRYFNNAPSAIVIDVRTGKVVVFGLGLNGTPIHGRWILGGDANWGTGEWFSDGGGLISSACYDFGQTDTGVSSRLSIWLVSDYGWLT
jgi:hypothetical protein